MRRLGAVALAVLVAGPAFGAACAPDRVDLSWPGGSASFRVELAETTEARARGLMFRDRLDSDRGMIFVYDQPQTVAFWMKNTLIPLDMLFIAADGRVLRIAEGAHPLDLTPISSGAPVRFVLEIGGGLSTKLGIGAGAVMQSPLVDPAQAARPCPAP